MKSYSSIAVAALVGAVNSQQLIMSPETYFAPGVIYPYVEAPQYYDPLYQQKHQLKEQAYLETMQKIYGTKVQGGNPLEDVERELKQAAYLEGLQNIHGHYNVQDPKVEGGNPLSDLEREMKQATYLSGMQNIYGHYANVQSPQFGYYDPLYQQKHQLKQQSYLETMQKIYGNKVQGGNPLEDVEREMKQATYLSGMQNIYGHYANVQSPQYGYYDPLYQQQHQLKQQSYLETMQKIYGTKVEDPKVEKRSDPLADVEREMKQQAYLSGMQNIYGHYANVQSPQWGYYDPLYQQKHQLKEQSYLETMQKIYGTKVESSKALKELRNTLDQADELQNIEDQYGPYVEAPQYGYYDPLYQQKHQLKEQSYLETMQKIYGTKVQDFASKFANYQNSVASDTLQDAADKVVSKTTKYDRYGNPVLSKTQKSTLDQIDLLASNYNVNNVDTYSDLRDVEVRSTRQ
ncbi:UNKNOWN [Stylonychia lemnae]|uniref:Uncharacterized protein n=1 Tax=Stylonychia lemnae TaxID=5949 RepID=A0A077ZRE6_STYLE|nr:UNKNOWN [Stylonychia lemnae]|eukprot:CDW72493.1 UNKNOWN [Stylonychia lemnae]